MALKILNVDEEGRFGGPERRIANVAVELYQQDVETVVVMPKLDSHHFQAYLQARCVNYTVLDITRLSLEKKILLRYVLRFWYEIFLMWRCFRIHKPDVVHVNGASQFKVAIAAWLGNFKVVWHLNNTYLKKPVKVVFFLVARLVDPFVIFAGSRAGRYYGVDKHFSPQKIKSIEAPVGIEFFDLPSLHKAGEVLNIIVVGGVNPAKGIEDVIDVAAELKARGYLFRIQVAGKILSSQNSYKKQLDRRISECELHANNFEFLGEVKDIPNLISTAHVCLSMSHREASPTAVWEGLASGRVVISSDVGSVVDYIVSGENGFIIPVGDSVLAADLIEKIVLGAIDTNRIGAKARELASQHFTTENIASRHRKAYESAIKAEGLQ